MNFDHKLKSFVKGMVSKINQKPPFFQQIPNKNIASMVSRRMKMTLKE